jgi:hypothetical protein
MHQALKQDLSVLEDGLTLLEHELPVGVGDIDIIHLNNLVYCDKLGLLWKPQQLMFTKPKLNFHN